MKIVFLSRYQNDIQRGAENFVEELSKRILKNHQVNILSGQEADNISKVIRGNFDIVIPVNGRLQSFKASLGRVPGKYKLLITGHSGIGRDDIWNIVVCKPNVFVALTDAMAKWAESWAWGSKVVKIHNGVDLEKFTPVGEKLDLGLDRPIILSVGALVGYKNHDKVIRAVKENRQGSVLIVGDGPQRSKLENLGRELLGNRFKITNFDYNDMPKVYRSCNLFTLPSWSREAFGLVYLEALASGLGVVAPDDSSRREIVASGGLFVDINNLKEYAGAIKKALDTDWSKTARNQAEQFSWEEIAKKYETSIFDMIKA